MDIIRTVFTSVWLLITLLCTAFILWRKLRRERVDNEDKIFDLTLVSWVVSLIFGRALFILFHLQAFGLDIAKWVTFWQYPGIVGVGSVLFGIVLFWKLLGNEWKDAIEQTDYLCITLSFYLFLQTLGQLCLQIVSYAQNALTSASGIKPVLDIRMIVVTFLSVLVYVGLFFSLSNLEKRYRTFQWYRAKRRSAQTGFVIACFLIAYGFFGFLFSWFMPMSIMVFGIGIDPIVKLLVMLLGFVLLYSRSGRGLFHQN